MFSISVGVLPSYGLYRWSYPAMSEPKQDLPLSLASEFKTKYKKGTFGRKFGNYFKDTSSSDEEWWHKKFNLVQKHANSEMFKNVESSKSLQTKCEAFYEKIISKNPQTTDSTFNEKDELDAWKLCSYLDQKPTSSSERKQGTLQSEDKNKRLINASIDNLFWKIKDKAFKEQDGLKLKISNSDSHK